MDYHFIIPKEDTPKPKRIFGSFFVKLLPVFVISAFLPLFILFISQPAELNFLTRAGDDEEIRIWFEPMSVVSSVENEANLAVYAHYESDNLLIPSISFSIESEANIANPVIVYKKPFNGQVLLGNVTVSSQKSGEFSVDIDKQSVDIVAFNKPLNIISKPAKIKFRE